MEDYTKYLASLESIDNYSVIINVNNKTCKYGSNDKFAIGSLSKSFGAYLLYCSVQQQLCAYEDLVSTYYPLKSDITLRDLIIHNTPYDSHLFTQLIDFGFDINFIKQKLSNEIPTKDKEFHYNNIFYVILSDILEKINKKPINELFNELVKSIGLNETGFTNNPIQGYYVDTEYKIKPTKLIRETSVFGFAGGIISTTNDMLLWANFIKKIPDFLKLYDGYWYGNGYWTADEKRITRCHTGSVFGYSTAFIIVPEYDISICALCNLTNALFPSRIINYIMRTEYNMLTFNIVSPLLDELPLPCSIKEGYYMNGMIGKIRIHNNTIFIGSVVGNLKCVNIASKEYIVMWNDGQYNYYNSDKIKQVDNNIELIFEAMYHTPLLCKPIDDNN